MAKWAVFLSGTGSNFQAMTEMRDVCDIRLVITDKSKARGVTRARRNGIPVFVAKKPLDWDAILVELNRRRIDSIFLLGFMRIVPAHFLARWKDQPRELAAASSALARPARQIINLHPSVLPLYPGLHSIEAAFADDQAPLGASIHHVIPQVDAGPFLVQKTLVSRELTFASAEFRVHRLEHRMVRKVVEKWKSLLIS